MMFEDITCPKHHQHHYTVPNSIICIILTENVIYILLSNNVSINVSYLVALAVAIVITNFEQIDDDNNDDNLS